MAYRRKGASAFDQVTGSLGDWPWSKCEMREGTRDNDLGKMKAWEWRRL